MKMCEHPPKMSKKLLLLQEELEKAATEKELISIDKEIDDCKKHLEYSRRKLSNEIRGIHFCANRRDRFNRDKKTPVTNTNNLFSSPNSILPSDLFSTLEVKNKFQFAFQCCRPVADLCNKHYTFSNKETEKNIEIQVPITDNNITSRENKPITAEENTVVPITDSGILSNENKPDTIEKNIEVPFTDNGITSSENKLNTTESFVKLQGNNRLIYNKQVLVQSAYSNWRKFTHERKLSKQTEREYGEQYALIYENKNVLRKYWNAWLHVVRDRKKILSVTHDKFVREEKIDTFLKTLQEQKQSLVASQTAAKMKNVHSLKRIGKLSQSSNHISQPAIKKCDKLVIKNNTFQTKSLPIDLNTEYKHRIKVQENIIAEQKHKLEEQSKLIKELQLAHLKLQTQKSTVQVQEEIHQTLSSCDLSLKPKAKQVKMRLFTGEVQEKKPIIMSLKTVPTILTRMEERAQEREKRWKLIKEKKQKLIEEKERIAKQEEEEKRKKEDYEKRCKIDEVREKRRLEKEMEIQKEREKERMHNLMIKASQHYKILLKRRVICAFQQIIMLKREPTEMAENHHKKQLLLHHFKIWREHVVMTTSFRLHRSNTLYKKTLLSRAFRGLWQIYSDHRAEVQVASDFYDLRLQERVFTHWVRAVCMERVETLHKQKKAATHYNRYIKRCPLTYMNPSCHDKITKRLCLNDHLSSRKLLEHTWKCWQNLSKVLHMEREREQRKQIWRMKVEEVLPDFKPARAVDW
ncbi:hypothetical protein ANN_05180 [Periplaneta americana]|uniref:Uncharacterized protein n=1 Tax=Periplaneta americana TaxID=6978 RepID=A0ABQ8TC61_PERAM|nr:hypothetical protein ANN_05180 [Periplaneta americana]